MMLVSLCTIVKNEEYWLPRMCELYAPLADEIIVVDTGSTDGTLAVQHSKLRLVPSAKFDKDTSRTEFSFGDARNEAIDLAQGEWILNIDPDYVITDEQVFWLRRFVESAEATKWDVLNFVIDSDSSRVSQPLLTRRSLGIRYYGICHEMLNIPETARRIPIADIKVTHVRNDKAQGVDAFMGRRRFYIDLINKEIEKAPNDYRSRYNLTLEYYQTKEYEKVLSLTSESLQNSSGEIVSPKHVSMLMWLRGMALFNTGEYRGGIGQEEMALRFDPAYVPAIYMLAEMKRLMGDLDGAEPLFQKLLTIKEPTGVFHRDFPDYRTTRAQEGLKQIQAARQTLEPQVA